MAVYELDPVDAIAVAAVGEPGHRRFYLLARGAGRLLTLACEKTQIQALIVRLNQMLEAQGIEVPEGAGESTGMTPGDPEWRIGEMGLGYHEARRMFVLVASRQPETEPEAEAEVEAEAPAHASDEDGPSVRFWLNQQQVVAFSKQAETVLTSGRPLCPRCGLPMDPSGHPCPVMNGARPIF